MNSHSSRTLFASSSALIFPPTPLMAARHSLARRAASHSNVKSFRSKIASKPRWVESFENRYSKQSDGRPPSCARKSRLSLFIKFAQLFCSLAFASWQTLSLPLSPKVLLLQNRQLQYLV